MVEGGGVWTAKPYCRINAAGEKKGDESGSSLRCVLTMSETNGAGSANSRHRKIDMVDRNHGRRAGFSRMLKIMRRCP